MATEDMTEATEDMAEKGMSKARLGFLLAAFGALLTLVMWFVQTELTRRHEKNAIASAILTEIYVIIDISDKHTAWWCKRVKFRQTSAPLIPISTIVYDKLGEEISLLDEDLI